MAFRLFVLYLLLELAAVVALVYTIGFGWTVLAIIATFFGGLVLAGSQARAQIRKLQTGVTTPQGAVTDSALVAIGTVLVIVPGVLSTVAGLLLLLPPTRAIARPAVTALAARSVAKRTMYVGGTREYVGRGEYIDGEVIDVVMDDAGYPDRPVIDLRKAD